MKLRVPNQQIAAGLAAVLFLSTLHGTAVIAEETTAPETESISTAADVPTEPEVTESETEASKLSSVTIVQGNEDAAQNGGQQWWKAELTEYGDGFSLVSYETASGSAPKGEAVDIDGDGIPDEESLKEPWLIAQGSGDNTVISNDPTQSAVSSVPDGQFAFTSYGWGHGVGMSQNGANFYAKYAGWNYQQILFHYYPGTVLMNTGTAETEIVTVQGVPGDVLMQVAEIVNREVGPSMHVETIKAQAVAVYTYMKYYNNDSHDLKGKPNPPQSLIDACASVLGEALYYNGDFAMTMFYASSGGITANCSDIFTANIPYLRSVISEYDAAYDPHYGDVTYFSTEQLKTRLQNAYGIRLSNNPENWLTLIEGNGGYVNKVVIDGQITVRGNDLRGVLDLKSPKFTYICSIAQPEPMTEAPTAAPTVPTEAQNVAPEQDNAEAQSDASES
ncbi:MAG: sporulation protein [Oscillospiraceae bacterium]|nr:sporulation protein [Oscillospiraceae bacterium]